MLIILLLSTSLGGKFCIRLVHSFVVNPQSSSFNPSLRWISTLRFWFERVNERWNVFFFGQFYFHSLQCKCSAKDANANKKTFNQPRKLNESKPMCFQPTAYVLLCECLCVHARPSKKKTQLDQLFFFFRTNYLRIYDCSWLFNDCHAFDAFLARHNKRSSSRIFCRLHQNTPAL